MNDQSGMFFQQVVQAIAASNSNYDRDLAYQMYALAVRQSAEYALAKFPAAACVRPSKYPGSGRLELLELALGMVTIRDGFHAEFGVYKGETLSFIANRIDTVAYGFDSFRGLPQDWFMDVRKGHFDLDGVHPKIEATQENFRLVDGLFADSIPVFKAAIHGPAAFLHIDCDLYDSAKAIFDGLGDRIVSGTVILFDEYLNYPGWQNHEFKAFQEFCAVGGRRYSYKAFCPTWFSVAVVME